MTYDGIIIGGGPAGMFAAITAARRGAKVLLLDKNVHSVTLFVIHIYCLKSCKFFGGKPFSFKIHFIKRSFLMQ